MNREAEEAAARNAAEVPLWRKAERMRLIAERLATPAETRSAMAAEIARRLDGLIGDPAGRTVGVYWPFRGEPDLRPWMEAIARRGARLALPVVIRKGAPLVFRSWAPGEKLEKGVWNIPVPAGGDDVEPDVVVSPLVGFDALGYRLGYGGGFYDRTLPTLGCGPTPGLELTAIGLAFEAQRVPALPREANDVRLEVIVTEAGVHHFP